VLQQGQKNGQKTSGAGFQQGSVRGSFLPTPSTDSTAVFSEPFFTSRCTSEPKGGLGGAWGEVQDSGERLTGSGFGTPLSPSRPL